METAAYVLNRSPVKNKQITPAEYLFGTTTEVGKMKVFGCLAYRYIPKEFRRKFSEKSKRCIFIGYTHTGYKLWFPGTNIIQRSSNVEFDENKYSIDLKVENENSTFEIIEEPRMIVSQFQLYRFEVAKMYSLITKILW